MPIKRILGVDPGTATTGYGVIDIRDRLSYEYIASGIIQTTNQKSMPERLSIIRSDFVTLLQQFKPDIAVIESIFFFRNAKTLVPVAQARGVVMEAAASAHVPVVEYTPMQVKRELTGYGKADKKIVQLTIAALLNHDSIIKPDDAADALALAICHARSMPHEAHELSFSPQFKSNIPMTEIK